MNGLVAAFAGALKDGDDGKGVNVESPIFAHQEFERLEAEGEARAGAAIRKPAEKLPGCCRKRSDEPGLSRPETRRSCRATGCLDSES